MSEDRYGKVIEFMPKKIKVAQKFIRGAANNILGYAYLPCWGICLGRGSIF